MAKLVLALAPTFKAKVDIPVPGERSVSVEFTFKGRTRDEFKEYLDRMASMEDVDLVMETITGWELDDPFGRDTVTKMTQVYAASARAIVDKYIKEVSGARLGN